MDWLLRSITRKSIVSSTVALTQHKLRRTDASGLLARSQVACAILALLLFAWMAEGVLSGSLVQFDLEARMFLHHWACPALSPYMSLLSTVGGTAFLSKAFAILFLVFLLARWRRDALWFTLTMAGAAVLTTVLKYSFHRPRPVPFFGTAPPFYSFPSGHALASLCFYGQLAIVLTARICNRPARVLVWLVAGIFIAAIGLSRVYLGVHYFSDVIAGYAVATAWISGLAVVQSANGPSQLSGPDLGAADSSVGD